MYKFIYSIFWLLLAGVHASFAQEYCQIKIPPTVDVIKKSPLAERNGNNKTYWICGNARVIFRTGDATIFVEAGCNVSLNNGNFTVYAKNGATVYIGNRCNLTLIREPQARINGGITTNGTDFSRPVGQECPVLNYDYSEAPDNLCPKLPMRDMPAPLAPVAVDTARYIPNTPVETPINPDLPTEANTDNRHILPANTQVINKQTNLYQSNGVFWVCKGSTLWVNGDNNTIYIEGGATATVAGNRNTIFMKTGGALTLNNGGANQLLYQDDADLKANKAKKTKFTKVQDIQFQTNAVSGGCN